MKKLLVIGMFLFSIPFVLAQDVNTQDAFWESLKKHCGKSYTGTYAFEKAPADFAGKDLVMYVMECSDNVIKIPFHVGDNLSRTWVFTRTADGIELKHDHRLEDGSHDKVTMYGGTTSNTGFADKQFFPADQETTDLISYASGNVWWVTVNDTEFSYNLVRADVPRPFRVVFDLTKEIPTPERPWGH